MGPTYPEDPPSVFLQHCRGLGDRDAERVRLRVFCDAYCRPPASHLTAHPIVQVLEAARLAAADGAGMECCYSVVDAATELLSHLNDTDVSCAICLAALEPEELEDATTTPCFHSFHNGCLFRWVHEQRQSWAADRFNEDAPIRRYVSACRGDAVNKV